jgi:hypothetical protein
MSTLILASDLYTQETWESITRYLDKICTSETRNHRKMVELEQDLDWLNQEVYEIDRDLRGRPLTPAEEVAGDALVLRWRGVEEATARMWGSPPVRKSALAALRGIHQRFLGPIEAQRETPVLYAVSRMLHNDDFSGFIEAYRIERSGIWMVGPNGERSSSATILEAPQWTWDLLNEFTATASRNDDAAAELREHYQSSYRPGGYPTNFWVGEPVPTGLAPVEEILTLWDPGEPDSPYWTLKGAVDAILRL